MKPTGRVDTQRNRARILQTAQRHSGELRLNDVARESGLGVGTVYRHFATVKALQDALAVPNIETLLALAIAAGQRTDKGDAFRELIVSTVELRMGTLGLHAALVDDTDDKTLGSVRSQLIDEYRDLLLAAQIAGTIRDDIDANAVINMLGGVEHSMRLAPHQSRATYLKILFQGMSPPT